MLTFEPLTLDHKNAIQSITSRFKPYSDFNFVSLYSWNADSQARVSFDRDALCLVMPDYDSGEPVATFLCRENHAKYLELCVAELARDSLPLVFRFIPEESYEPVKDYLEKEHIAFKFEEDRDQFDYILDVSTVVDMTGKEFADFRYKLNRSSRLYDKQLVETNRFDPRSLSEQKAVLLLGDSWARQKYETAAAYEEEMIAFRKFLEVAPEVDSLRYTIFRLNGNVVGFASIEVLDPQFAQGHFLKYDPSVPHMYQRLVHAVCRQLRKEGVASLNIEQDLGLQGLRQAKTGLRPVSMLKKYRLEIMSGM